MITCEYCGTIFSRDYNLRKHQRIAKYCLKLQESIAYRIVCEYCGRTFSTEYNLRKHQHSAIYCLKLRGYATEKHICEYCQREYGRKDALYKHQRSCIHLQPSTNAKEVDRRGVETQNVQLLELITQLQTIATMQQKTSNTTNINRNNIVIQNMTPTDESIQEHIKQLCINCIQET